MNAISNADAVRMRTGAKRKRQFAEEIRGKDPTGAWFEVREAHDMDIRADEKLTLKEPAKYGTGGEMVPQGGHANQYIGTMIATSNPDSVTSQASIERINLADEAGAFDLAFDAAESIKARDSFEKMLSHQMAAAHLHSMKLLARSLREPNTIEASRLANTAVRLMNAYQGGMLTLAKVRTGGRQTVVVQHVQVNEGAQAVIGNVQTGGSPYPGQDGNND